MFQAGIRERPHFPVHRPALSVTPALSLDLEPTAACPQWAAPALKGDPGFQAGGGYREAKVNVSCLSCKEPESLGT